MDDHVKVIHVDPAPAGRTPIFEGGEGIPIHDKLVSEMLAVYRETDLPVFLDGQAAACLAEGKMTFQTSRLDHASIVEEDDMLHLFAWRGTKSNGHPSPRPSLQQRAADA